MPPASVATTLLSRILSSSDVLPWSTWPMMVTIGGRCTSLVSSVGCLELGEDLLLDVLLLPILISRPSSRAISSAARFVEGGVDGRHLALGHQLLDELVRLDAEVFGEGADRDRRVNAQRRALAGQRALAVLPEAMQPGRRGESLVVVQEGGELADVVLAGLGADGALLVPLLAAAGQAAHAAGSRLLLFLLGTSRRVLTAPCRARPAGSARSCGGCPWRRRGPC